MKKIVSYPISIIFYLIFGILLCIFHPIQWICLNLFGYQAHKKTVDYLNFGLTRTTHILGTTYRIKNLNLAPKGVPIIIVANHQSMFDIPPIIWFFRRLHPKFISKKELGKRIPSVSYNLRHGGSVLIDRKDPSQAIPQIQKIAEYIEKNNRSVVIFPEGTRSKTGQPRKFSENGLKTLCLHAPSAYILPVTINNSWKMVRFGSFPMGLASRISYTVHPALKVSDLPIDKLLQKTEAAIVSAIRV